MRADPEQEKKIKHDINYALDDNLSLRKMPTIHKYNQHPQNIHCSFFQKWNYLQNALNVALSVVE